MNCKQVQSRLADLSTENVTARLEDSLRGHLACCQSCAREWSSLERTLKWLDHVPEMEPSVDLWTRVEGRIGVSQPPRNRALRFLGGSWNWGSARAPALAGGLAVFLGGILFLKATFRESRTISAIPTANATFLSQHISMDRGELFTDPVALGAMASLVTTSVERRIPQAIRNGD
ncbi:MAG: hypothetical protein HY318_20015 [Armatimonadetes bacterium]|nr:hypothetical protein [Armatimonadota bacterium]